MTPSAAPTLWSRREWLITTGLGLAAGRAVAAPAARVAIARCTDYGTGVLPALRKMFDGIGGIGPLVTGKSVAIKINMANPLRARTGHRPGWYTRWSHPAVIAAAVSLIGSAGARRIRILEGSYEDDNPLEENFLQGGWDPRVILGAAANVEMENTDSLGLGKKYERLKVPGGGAIYPSFDCNHSYVDCDVLVSIAKLKEHRRRRCGPVDEQHDRDRTSHHLRRCGGVRRAGQAAVRASRHVPRRPPATLCHRARGAEPGLAPRGRVTASRG